MKPERQDKGGEIRDKIRISFQQKTLIRAKNQKQQSLKPERQDKGGEIRDKTRILSQQKTLIQMKNQKETKPETKNTRTHNALLTGNSKRHIFAAFLAK